VGNEGGQLLKAGGVRVSIISIKKEGGARGGWQVGGWVRGGWGDVV
jgi:hypothetical protein